MKFTIYASAHTNDDFIYSCLVSYLPPKSDFFLIRSIFELETQLRSNQMSDMVIVLIPYDDIDMAAVHQLKNLLRGVRLMIVLPSNCNGQMLNCAHDLYPRYVCFQSDGLPHLKSVFEKLSPSFPDKAL